MRVYFYVFYVFYHFLILCFPTIVNYTVLAVVPVRQIPFELKFLLLNIIICTY